MSGILLQQPEWIKINSVFSFQNKKPNFVEVTMTLKPLNQAEANLKFNSPIPKASISAPVSPALMT